MKTLEDLTHQLFSRVLINSRSKQTTKFEGEEYESGHGFSITSGDTAESFYLTEKIGLLGLHHPLQIKSSMKAALTPSLFAGQLQLDELINHLESFFTNILDTSCFVGSYDSSVTASFGSGRFTHFLSNQDIEKFINEGSISINHVFPFPITLHRVKPPQRNFPVSLSMSHYLYCKDLLRLLSSSALYINNKGNQEESLIHHKSKNLREQFSSIKLQHKVDGLSVIFSNPIITREFNLHTDKNTMHFPLLYSQDMIENFIQKFKDSYVYC